MTQPKPLTPFISTDPRVAPEPTVQLDDEPRPVLPDGVAEYKCQNKACGKLFAARTADRARGWARFCSKSCKAVKQEARTHQYRELLQRGPHEGGMTQEERDHREGMEANEAGWDGHKQVMP